MDFFPLIIVPLLVVLTTWFYFRWQRRVATKLPPGPYPFPIIGNILQLGKNPHQSLAKLSQTYGPLMSLHLGYVYTVVVSSPEIAREILQKHDLIFSSRTTSAAFEVNDRHNISIALLPIGDQWRKLRKLSKEQMFTIPRLEASEGLRQEKLQELHDYVQKFCDSGKEVNIAEAIFMTTLNLMSITLFSIQVTDFDSHATEEIKKTMETLTTVVGTPNFADYFPILKPFDLQGIRRKCEFVFMKLHGFIEDLINQRLEERSKSQLDSPKKTDFLEILLDLMEEGREYNFSMKEVQQLLLDLFIAGSETTSSTAEWALTELLLSPEKLSKTKQELRTVIGKNKQVQESDISRLPYFQAVIKEVLRLHPPAPFLMPHKSVDDVQVNGYTIPKGTHAMINVWAIGRDPKIWKNPDSFEPERFLDNKIDFKGLNFELIPFGSGRRICPGMPLANRMLHVLVATLIHNFDWKFEVSAEAEETQRKEVFGLALQKVVPLKATPVKCEA